jgi:chloramphenicol-sensitive protein RarD
VIVYAPPGPTPEPKPTPVSPSVPSRPRGLVFALLAYGAWGFFPLYFKALPGIPAWEVLAHRVVWSVVLLSIATPLLGRWPTTLHALGRGKRHLIAMSALLIAVNWGTYIWAVQAGRVLQASLGYFVNPLVSVLLGVIFLHERLRPLQLWAIGLAGVGVAALVVSRGEFPWLPLVLALSFGLYGLVRKRAGVDPVGGLLAETAILAPLALGLVSLLALRGQGALGRDLPTTLLLMAAGPITAVPLVWFALGVRSLKLSTVGLLQYVTPTLQFLLAVVLFHEEFTTAHAVAFGFIWSALVLYSLDSLRAARQGGEGADVAPSTPPVEG